MRLISTCSRMFWVALIMGYCGISALSQNDQRQTAFSLEQQGKYAEAEAAWRGLSKAYPANPEPFAHLGLLESRQEHYTEAIAFYRTAMALDPAMPGLSLNLGLACFKAGEYKDAIRIFEPLLKTEHPSSPEAQRLTILLGMSHYGLGEYAAAAPYLNKAAESDAQNLTLLLTLAHSCLLSTQYPCVLDAYHRIVALNAESAEAHILVGEALDAMKEPVGALRELRAAVAANPKEPNVHFGLGYLLWTSGQYPEAAQEFQAEIANDPRHVQAMLYLADSDIQINRSDEARPLLEKIVKANPDSSMGHRDLGVVYADADRKEDALRELQIAARLSPADVNAHWRLGRLYRSMGRITEAKAEFDKAGSLNKAADEELLKVMSRIPAKNQSSQGTAGVPAEK